MRKYKVLLKTSGEHAFTVLASSRLTAAKVGAVTKILSLKKFLKIFTIEK